MPTDRHRLLREDEWQSSVLRESAEKMNFILLVASAYRPPEFLSFLEALRCTLGEVKEFLEFRAALRRACGPDV